MLLLVNQKSWLCHCLATTTLIHQRLGKVQNYLCGYKLMSGEKSLVYLKLNLNGIPSTLSHPFLFLCKITQFCFCFSSRPFSPQSLALASESFLNNAQVCELATQKYTNSDTIFTMLSHYQRSLAFLTYLPQRSLLIHRKDQDLKKG